MIFLLKYNEQIGLVTARIITIRFLIVSYVMIYIPGNCGPFKPHAILRGPLQVEHGRRQVRKHNKICSEAPGVIQNNPFKQKYRYDFAENFKHIF